MILDLNSFHVFKGWRVPWDGPRYAVSRNGNPRSLTVLSTSCTVIEPPTKAVSNLFFKPTFVLVLSVSAPRTIPTTMAAYRLKRDRLLPCQRTLCTTWKNTTPIRKNLILKGSLKLTQLIFVCVNCICVLSRSRWTPENKAKRSPYTYMAFGTGPRNCVGMRFAMEELKMAICTVVQKFRFFPVAETPVRNLFVNTSMVV